MRSVLLLILCWFLQTVAPAYATDEDAKACVQVTSESMRRGGEGDFAGALELANEALHGACSRLPATSMGRGFVLMAVGTAKMELKDWAGAEAALTAGLANYEKTLDPKDELLALAQNDVGAFYGRTGRYAKAKRLLTRAIALYQEIGDESLDINLARSYKNLAVVEHAQDDFEAAAAAMEKALPFAEKHWGTEHRETFDTALLHGLYLLDNGKCVRAKRELESTLARGEKAYGLTDPLVGEALRYLGKANMKLGNLDAAEGVLHRAVAIANKHAKDDPAGLSNSLAFMGWLKLVQRNYSDANTLLKQVLAIDEATYGPDDPELVSTLDRLAEVCTKQGDRKCVATYEARARRIKVSMQTSKRESND